MSDSDFRDEEEFYDDLDNRRQMSNDALSDDFASFNAARYLQERRARRQPYTGQEPEEIDLGPYRGRSARTGYADEDDLSGTVGPYRRSRLRQTRRRTPVVETDSELSVLGSLANLEPGIRIAVLGFGCFGILFLVGACGLILWVAGQLANR